MSYPLGAIRMGKDKRDRKMSYPRDEVLRKQNAKRTTINRKRERAHKQRIQGK